MSTKLLAILLAVSASSANIPQAWTQSAVDSLELPLSDPRYSPTHISPEEYYAVPERVIYKSYPIYIPGREPIGYVEWLRQREPELAFDATRLRSRNEWIKAGEIVFNAAISYAPVFFNSENLRDPMWLKRSRMPVAKDGTIPFARWVIRQKGKIELGSMGCNTCHTRVLPTGTVVPGAQGNNPNDFQGALLLQRSGEVIGEERALAHVRAFAEQFEAPWARMDPNALPRTMTLKELIAAGKAIPAGVTARVNTSIILPPQIPDLIGVRERRYLDHTGLVHHRGITDFMRYASLSQDVYVSDRYLSLGRSKTPTVRYSDAQLYALTLYVYSLHAPANPNLKSAAAARGKIVFQRARCGRCHSPPLFTNNKLVPVDGFTPSNRVDIMKMHIGTDPAYALLTRKATGYYKVPSLKGVWYRGPFGHNGSAATLHDWFDPIRLEPNYVPTGFKGFDGTARTTPGHVFGLDLSPQDRHDLIAYLNTL